MKTISIDFDGVIHSYTSPWTKADEIRDPPVPGAIQFLRDLVLSDQWDVCIFSTRNKEPQAIVAMQRYLLFHAIESPNNWVEKIRFPTEKPLAFIGIDDRVLTFTGKFPSFQELENFKPWNKK